MPKSTYRSDYNRSERKNLGVDRECGFTLLETSIAMVIMLVAVLASASLFAYSIKNNSGANDRELAMGVAQQQMEQLRNAPFTDGSLTATAGTTTTITRAGRQYTVLKIITDSNTVSGQPTLKTITTRVTPLASTLGAVTLRTRRSTLLKGPY
jgi:prepilin-type N-terminal cleavage/methylation domain-containing protein